MKIPRHIADYKLLDRVGLGAMGVVFKARQNAIKRIVAMKILWPKIAEKDQSYIDAFIREARASAVLNHPNIVRGIDVGKDKKSGLYYFVMEYVDGANVRQLLNQVGPVGELRTIQITKAVTQALVCSHKSRIIHRDIKPDNILVTYKGDVKLADLGLAKRTIDYDKKKKKKKEGEPETPLGMDDPAGSIKGKAKGTPYYMAPEQALGKDDLVDIRSDLYALGATMYHMLAGVPPYTGGDAKTIMKKAVSEEVPDIKEAVPHLTEETADLVYKLMEKKPEDRYAAPADLLEDLEELEEELLGEVEKGKEKKAAAKPAAPAAPAPAPVKLNMRRRRKAYRRR